MSNTNKKSSNIIFKHVFAVDQLKTDASDIVTQVYLRLTSSRIIKSKGEEIQVIRPVSVALRRPKDLKKTVLYNDLTEDILLTWAKSALGNARLRQETDSAEVILNIRVSRMAQGKSLQGQETKAIKNSKIVK